jgi:cellulose synthase/poly-beta-1,6-N-acetylglucosamine synthase-like glycosyltransferase
MYIYLIISLIIAILIGGFNSPYIIEMFIGFLLKPRVFKKNKNLHKYLILVPAHNEQNVIEQCLKALTTMHYPKELFDIYVIADNCSKDDQTINIAKKMGVKVIERHDLSQIGPNFAVHYALKQFRSQNKK